MLDLAVAFAIHNGNYTGVIIRLAGTTYGQRGWHEIAIIFSARLDDGAASAVGLATGAFLRQTENGFGTRCRSCAAFTVVGLGNAQWAQRRVIQR